MKRFSLYQIFGGGMVMAEHEASVIDILQTVTWREALDMLLGAVAILCFIIGLVFAFGE